MLIAIEHHRIKFLETCPKPFSQGSDAQVVSGHAVARQQERFTHANDLMRWQGTRAHTALMTTAMHLGFDAYAGLAPHVQCTNPFGTIDFVCRQRHQVHR
ncbi:hypothetical protein GALL_417600 [mine drainage metagenome]|uniref:Uncharacterized protein n=1 Tax=mine drainage metagenome TaxID=410659 RepID=A0A1J5Q983_9ZZZZ